MNYRIRWFYYSGNAVENQRRILLDNYVNQTEQKNNASDRNRTRPQQSKTPDFTRALKKTRFHKAKRVFSVYRNGKFNKFADDK